MRYILMASAAIAFATTAHGGTIEPTPLAPAPVFVDPGPTWTGGYVGLGLGYADMDESENDVDDSGVIGGLRAGYDYDFGTFVLGGLLHYDVTDVGFDSVSFDVDEIARLGLRAGGDFGRNLFYATGGYAYVDTDGEGDSDGYFAGLGFERLVTDSISAGAEVLYHEFDDFSDPDIDLDATTAQVFVNYRF